MSGSLTAQGSVVPHAFGTSDMAFHFLLQCRHPGARYFRGSMAGLYMPLSTLQGWPHGQPHMTQGRYGSLRLYRMTLSFTTTCRFSPALSGRNGHEICGVRQEPHAEALCSYATLLIRPSFPPRVRRAHRFHRVTDQSP